MRHYKYVGPAAILKAVADSPPGVLIRRFTDLSAWLIDQAEDAASDGTITATFVVDVNGVLLLAPRRSEHVACAAGGPVQSAGEITMSPHGEVLEISNLSTGFCPEPESWSGVAAALDQIPIQHPGQFTTSVVFRLCPACGERNVVKDSWFVCEFCGGDLPDEWNFPC